MSFFFDQMFNFFFRKCDASSLAVIRIIIGILLLFDIVHERGLSRAETIWSDSNECRFPLFNGLLLLPMRGMFAIYLFMFIGNVGIILGFYYKFSCILYLSCYWYLFLLDKSRWNNHSYLFGLLVLLLSISNANYKWSIDYTLRNSNSKERRVPFWQYFLIRSQIFLVYFIAGLKKFDRDWLNGYSMNYLSEHWVFSPFRLILTNESIDYFIVHLGGFLFDLTIGFFLVYSKSRPLAYLFCALFNFMNSRIFSIGMFPYVMIAIMPVFSADDWPKQLIRKFSIILNKPIDKMDKKEKKKTIEKIEESVKKDTKEKTTIILIIVYLSIQLLLPHSHWLTKGYNTWTNGLYGYSWDMMVHNWKHIHTRVTVVDKSKRKFYLNPEAWTKSWRWSHHSDMVKQYAICAHKHLTKQFNITEPSIYIDTWISLNGRFAQRVYDPRIDMVRAKWTPFERPEWVLPILSHLAEWRTKIKTFEQNSYEENEDNSLVFIADFPGLSLSNYIGSDFENTSLIVLKGWLKIEIEGHSTRIMSSGDRITIPSKRFHKLSPIKSEPAAYVFIFSNNSQQIPNEVQYKHLFEKQESETHKYENPWIRSLRNMSEGLRVLIEICLTLFKRFFICLNMCEVL